MTIKNIFLVFLSDSLPILLQLAVNRISSKLNFPFITAIMRSVHVQNRYAAAARTDAHIIQRRKRGVPRPLISAV